MAAPSSGESIAIHLIFGESTTINVRDPPIANLTIAYELTAQLVANVLGRQSTSESRGEVVAVVFRAVAKCEVVIDRAA
jgi:hypothetical protein